MVKLAWSYSGDRSLAGLADEKSNCFATDAMGSCVRDCEPRGVAGGISSGLGDDTPFSRFAVEAVLCPNELAKGDAMGEVMR